MKMFKSAAFVVALLGAAALGAMLTPVAHGQTTVWRSTPRAVDLIGGRGSEIGVSIREVEDEDAKTGKLSGQAGVVVDDVTAESPAEKAGLKKGDIVVEYDGERVRSVRQFTRLVEETPAGRKIPTAVVRNGQKTSLTIEPREREGLRVASLNGLRDLEELGRNFSFDMPAPARPSRPAPPAPPAPPAFPDIDSFLWRAGSGLGVTVGDLSPQLADYFGTKDGVLVTSVVNDSAASRAGLKAGDVVTAFNGSSVGSPAELRRQIQRLEAGDDFTIAVVRDKKAQTLKGKMEERRERRRTVHSIE
jgi:serine protease Do